LNAAREAGTATAQASAAPPTLDAVLAACRRHGETDEAYLVHHYPRFLRTFDRFHATTPPRRGARVLDLGAHWLHQALVWREAGYEVVAVDIPATFSLDAVRALAEAHAIQLLACADLDAARELERIPDASIDVVLFTEIIEHITFNPRRLWDQVRRAMAPGARIVVTTPNYYAFGSRAWQLRRVLRGGGGGIRVEDILDTPTYGHHWKEFSAAELTRYFELLSPEFRTVKLEFTGEETSPSPRRSVRWLQRRLPWLRPELHLEVERVRGVGDAARPAHA
jgi:SAM-dependent methyltransferase